MSKQPVLFGGKGSIKRYFKNPPTPYDNFTDKKRTENHQKVSGDKNKFRNFSNEEWNKIRSNSEELNRYPW